jgi:hypothetical protein
MTIPSILLLNTNLFGSSTMRLKILLLAAIFAIGFIEIYTPQANAADGILDTKVMSGNDSASFDVIPTLRLAAGGGYEVCDNDSYLKKDAAMTYWVSAKITIDSTFAVVREVKVMDKMKSPTNTKQGKDTQIGFGLHATI